MTISKIQLDNLNKSILVSKVNDNYQMKHRFDKLSVVGNIQSNELAIFYNRLNQLKSDEDYIIKRDKSKGDGIKSLYSQQVSIRSLYNKKQVLVINYIPTKMDLTKTDEYKGRGAIRVEVSPQHYSAEDMTKLIVYLGKNKRLGKYVYQLLKTAWVTRIDYALDIYNMRLSDYHIGFLAARSGERYPNEGELQGQKLGSDESEHHLSCYEKLDVGEDLVSLNALPDDELQLNVANWRDIRHYRQFLRLEVRYKPRKKKLLLRNLHSLHNLLERVRFYNKPLLAKNGDLEWEALLSVMTLPELRKYIKKLYPKKEADRLIDCFVDSLESNQVDIFNKDDLWCDLHLLIDKLGILGKPQYWQLKHRQRWLKSQKVRVRPRIRRRRIIM
ncbi:hypothetical protein J6836_08460 [Providencia sp. R33]|uniref:hypothetical protein n=1 Tax=Providencia sp. R33 TaxID=2828763 RepID=UPI001C5B0115|nr:hypothetical protein [Providencia sp. R33]QXX84390.1 hypothetical protein J6836_08460 [Providencia sp. R33]